VVFVEKSGYADGGGIAGWDGIERGWWGERGRKEEKRGRIKCVVWRTKVGGGVSITDAHP